MIPEAEYERQRAERAETSLAKQADEIEALRRQLAECREQNQKLWSEVHSWKTSAEVHHNFAEGLEQELIKCEQKRDNLLALVKMVEWVHDPETPEEGEDLTEYLCPYCFSEAAHGHTRNCPRQQALGGAEGE